MFKPAAVPMGELSDSDTLSVALSLRPEGGFCI